MVKKLFFTITLLTTLIFSQASHSDEIKIKDIYGNTTSAYGTKNGLIIEKAKGKIVLLEFWGTHCPPCMFSIPHYIEINKKYKDKVAMYAVEVQATPKEKLLDFVKQKGINYNILTQKENSYFVNYIAHRSNWIGSIPFLIIFNQKGDVVNIKTGMVSQEYIENIIQYLTTKKDSQKESNKTKN